MLEIVNDVIFDYQDGYNLRISNERKNLIFPVIYSSNKDQPPIAAPFIYEGRYWQSSFSHYVGELKIKIYELNIDSKLNYIDNELNLKFVFEHDLNLRNKNVLFELYPETELELSIWLKYISTIFEPTVGCKCYISKNIESNFFENYKNLQQHTNIYYYKKFKIDRNETPCHRVFPTKNKTSYEIINDSLLKS